MRAFKVGGIWFLRLWRVQFSLCICRRPKVLRGAKLAGKKPKDRWVMQRQYRGNRIVDLSEVRFLDLCVTGGTPQIRPRYSFKASSLRPLKVRDYLPR